MQKPKFSYAIDEVVRIKSGQFASFVGRVKEVNEEKAILKIVATIFGRTTQIELSFSGVEKVNFTKE